MEYEEHYKFKMEQTVTHVATDIMAHKLGFTVLLIVARQLDECHGGIQKHYICRHMTEEGLGTGTTTFAETELRAVDVEILARNQADKEFEEQKRVEEMKDRLKDLSMQRFKKRMDELKPTTNESSNDSDETETT